MKKNNYIKNNNKFSDWFFKNIDFNIYIDIQKYYILNKLLVNGYTMKSNLHKYICIKFENWQQKKRAFKLDFIYKRMKNTFLINKLTNYITNRIYE